MESFQILYDGDISLAPLENRKIAIMGYGNQGRPQALNAKDSGLTVKVALRENSRNRDQAIADGFEVLTFEAATQWADVLMMMLPDDRMGEIYTLEIAPFIRPGQYLGFCHGLVIHAGWLEADEGLNVFLVAPKAQGRGVRNKYLMGSGVPGLFCIHHDPSGDTREVALAYAKAIGCGRVGILPTTFKEETECDLFSEQAVLCGGLTSLIKAAYETLVENGFSPATAYFECLYEVKLIGDLLHDRGITGMREAISSTALFGDLSRGERIIDSHVKATMQEVLDEITSGQFARQMKREFAEGKPNMKSKMEADYHHPIEETFRQMRDSLKLGQS